ncbi:MAG: ABC transporter permease [Cyclobacteriaceae bacterium]|jgi:putative ABC transport system permease protein|nr:ABC transporter [Cytophagales bacterium]HNP76172.1 ABC transporter permease [Cyclobacteriaceae bacterium]HQQ82557.1 ABC transporter permease [Cyclobacteriaceae bacterium]
MLVLRLIGESFAFAWKALKSNVLRTILSLLGVTVGIFAIIAVFTLVDSLESNIKSSFDFLGTGVIYVGKMPWAPEGNGPYKWWEYWRRPTPSYSEYKFLNATMRNKTAMSIFAVKGNAVVRNGNNSIGQIALRGTGESYDEIYEVNVAQGRYFTRDEIDGGRSVAILGHEVALTLFPNGMDPVGQEVKVKDMKYKVIGVIKREGQSFLGTPSNDFSVLIPYHSFRKLYQTGTGRWNELQSTIGIKGSETDLGLVELENEIKGLMRSRRGLRPIEKDNFALNRPEAIMNAIGKLFDVVGWAGWIIGGFSILVGGFGIANIMFVSVKERTSIIGLQKSLGAKNYFILFQFLFEAIFLSLIGGLGGILLVFMLTFIPFGSLEVVLSFKNIVLGLGVSSVIGLIAGIVPAAVAARLDPVIAIRS